MLRSLARFALPMLVLGLMISSALAQPGGRGQGGPGGRFGGGFGGGFGGPGGGGGNISFLLMDEKVRTELGLVEDQTTKIRELSRKVFEGMGEQFRTLRDLPEEERDAKAREMRESLNANLQKEINEVLLPAQRERLKQIQVQSRLRGSTSDGLASKEIAEAINLTEAQKEELKKVQEEAEKEMREKQEALRQEVKDKVLKVLTADQKAKLEKLMGAKMEFTQFGQGGRGPGGDRGGDRGGNRPAANPTTDDN